MSDAPIHAGQGLPLEPRPIDGQLDATGKARQPATEDGVAFRALLEQLEVRAQELRQTSNAELEPASLPGAVERARESLEEALSLGDELLEAYREVRQQGLPGSADGGSRP